MKLFARSKIALVIFVVWLLVPAQHCRAGRQGTPVSTNSRAVSITVLYDNYTLTEGLRTDWGFACMIKGMEKNILFDTGTNGSLLLENMDKLQVRAQDVDLVAISHNHLDHTGGLSSFLGRNSNVSVYLPPSASGAVPTTEATGASAQIVTGPMQICEGVHLTGPMSGPAVEQALVLETPKGLVVATGCAHPGIVNMIKQAKQMLNKDVYFVFGGFHLLNYSDSQLTSTIQQFQELGVHKVGATHCTGPRAIELFKQQYGADFVPIGVGQITIPTEYDSNGDEIVDCADICIMVDHWHTDTPSFDVAPPLFGDGIVDVQDLIVLAEHLFEEVLPPELVAYWKLDETEGSVANDSAGVNDGTLKGDPLWQPAGGAVDGALAFDGTDDYVSTDFVLNPADGPFSVFAWIKGTAPGQAIISQTGGTNWLLADPSEGKLRTSLLRPGGGRTAPQPLISEFIITDGNWHRVGFVWDGSNRILYADGAEVARDTQSGLESSEGGLYIGAGSTLDAANFWTGLIDDVRIYDRAITP